MKRYFLYYFILFCIFAFACNHKTDQQILMGKWQNEQDWFEFISDTTYNAGKDFVTLVHAYKYSIDISTHQLSLYTQHTDKSYYLKYFFSGEDTLLVRNLLSTDTTLVTFVRVKE